MLTYLDRQDRNEYITLASQIAYDGSNIAFVFYENQIRQLTQESPFEERKLEVLQASCVGQPREMVNLFCDPKKSMSTSERIEKALSRLRQRYGVTAGLTSEPKVKAVRYGPKVSYNSASLKMFNEDLNTLEVFAYAHDEPRKPSGQLLLDTVGCLPIILKCRYLDYLDKLGLDISQPGFESLRKFAVHEIAMMVFFKQDERERPRDSGSSYKDFRVRQVGINADNRDRDEGSSGTTSNTPRTNLCKTRAVKPSDGANDKSKPPPVCFVCSKPDPKDFLMDCEIFKDLSPKSRRQTVIEAKKCLNCLSLDHIVRNCPRSTKCRKYGPRS